MSERTIIMDGSNPERENEERTRIASQEEFKQDFLQNQKKQIGKLSKIQKVGMVAGGLGAAGIAMSFMPSNAEEFDEEQALPLPEEPPMATTVTDSMSYNDAWEAAREEVGPGGFFVWNDHTFSTYTQEEWNQLDKEDQQDFTQNMQNEYNEYLEENPIHTNTVVMHDGAPLADTVSDDMSFGDAFALARQEVGPGGVFVWHGKTYNTYYKEEWQSMDEGDRDHFMASTNHIDTSHIGGHIENPGMDNVHPAIVIDNDVETFVRDEMLTLDTGEQVHVGYFLNNGEPVVKMDIDNDNNYDYILDPQNNQLIGLNGNQDMLLDDILNPGGGVEVQPIATEYTQIDGHDALVTAFSDGHIEAQIDFDGDGAYDSKMSMDEQGHMFVYDNHGNLIEEQQIDIDDPYTPPFEPYGVEYVDNEITHDDTNDLAVNNNPTPNFIDDQIHHGLDLGDDFNDHGDVSGWVHDDLA